MICRTGSACADSTISRVSMAGWPRAGGPLLSGSSGGWAATGRGVFIGTKDVWIEMRKSFKATWEGAHGGGLGRVPGGALGGGGPFLVSGPRNETENGTPG